MRKSTLSDKNRRLLFALITVVLVIVAVEGVSWLALKLLDEQFDIRYRPMLTTDLSPRHQEALERFIDDNVDHTGFSAALGWTIKPNTSVSDGLYISNSKRIRAKHEYPISPPPNKVRIATFGDSYTFGMEVSNEQTWQEQLVKRDNRFEIINFGIGGHSLDQGYLRYLDEGSAYSPDIVMVGFMSENINRVVSVYRPYYVEQTGLPLTKPRFILEDGELKLIKNPHQKLEDYKELLANPKSVLPTLGEHDFFYHTRYAENPMDSLAFVRFFKIVLYDLLSNKIYDRQENYNEDSEAYRLMLKLFEVFHTLAIKRGSLPIIVIYPEFRDVFAVKERRPKKYQALLSWLQTKDYMYVDLMDAFELFNKSNPMGGFFTERLGHYSPSGNEFVANQALDFLIKNELTTRESIKFSLVNIVDY